MTDHIIAKPAEIYAATLTVHTDGATVESEPAIVRPGQAAEARVTMDSTTGRIGTATIDVFDVES